MIGTGFGGRVLARAAIFPKIVSVAFVAGPCVNMAKVHSKRISYLAPRPFEDGSGWYVEAKWIDRPAEQLGRFDTYSEARNWITLESFSYFALREIGPMVKHPE